MHLCRFLHWKASISFIQKFRFLIFSISVNFLAVSILYYVLLANTIKIKFVYGNHKKSIKKKSWRPGGIIKEKSASRSVILASYFVLKLQVNISPQSFGLESEIVAIFLIWNHGCKIFPAPCFRYFLYKWCFIRQADSEILDSGNTPVRLIIQLHGRR